MSTSLPYWPTTVTTTGTYSVPISTAGTTYTIGAATHMNRGIDIEGNATINGNADISGNLSINGRNIMEVLEGIEQRLAILHPNKKLEEKWARLKALGDMYRELEKEVIEKEQIWATLKK